MQNIKTLNFRDGISILFPYNAGSFDHSVRISKRMQMCTKKFQIHVIFQKMYFISRLIEGCKLQAYFMNAFSYKLE